MPNYVLWKVIIEVIVKCHSPSCHSKTRSPAARHQMNWFLAHMTDEHPPQMRYSPRYRCFNSFPSIMIKTQNLNLLIVVKVLTVVLRNFVFRYSKLPQTCCLLKA
jgi:hypothetical protein